MMKRYLFSFGLLCLVFLAGAQPKLAGRYSYHIPGVHEWPFINQVLTLNCDKTFVAVDTATKSISKGTWSVKKNNKLVLRANTVIIRSKQLKNNPRALLYIRTQGLHNKVMSRKKYNRQNKRFNRHHFESMSFEKYEKFKERQEGIYYKKIDYFNCL